MTEHERLLDELEQAERLVAKRDQQLRIARGALLGVVSHNAALRDKFRISPTLISHVDRALAATED